MEPADAKVRYVILARVVPVTLREMVVNTKIVNGVLQDVRESLDWFVHFNGSREALFLGYERPDFNTDDIVKITFERMPPNAKFERPSE